MTGISKRVIRRILTKKVDEWISTITDARVQELAKRDTIVTGGSIASMLMGEPVNDYDVYFKTLETTKAIAQYYVDLFNVNNPKNAVTPFVQMLTESMPSMYNQENEDPERLWYDTEECTGERVTIRVSSSGVVKDGGNDQEYEYFEITDNSHGDKASAYLEEMNTGKEIEAQNEEQEDKFRPVFLSENAVTLSHKMQLVIRFYGEPEEIHNNYDFIHAMNYYEHKGENLVLKVEALESLMAKRLHYVGSLYPVCSIFRMRKFIERGWHVSAGEVLKMAFQVSELDLSNIHVLKEQLTGIDQAYFHQVIKIINENKDADINSTYLAEIIDRVFNK